MNWINGMLKRFFPAKAPAGYSAPHASLPQQEMDHSAAWEPDSRQQPPGETAGRHALQRHTRITHYHSRLPLDSQNAIFFSGINK